MQKIILAILVLLSLFSLVGAIIYKIYALNSLGILVAILLSLVIFLFLFKYKFFPGEEKEAKDQYLFNPLWSSIYLLLLIVSFYVVFKSQTAASITSPWETVPDWFFLFYFLTTLLLLINIIKKSHLSLLFLSLYSLLTISIILIVYKIGYGYDPFIHEASLRLIEDQGAISPKSFLYSGQYALILIIHKLTGLSLVWLNQALVPVLAAIFLPYIVYNGLKHLLADRTKILLALTLLYTLPFSFLTFTTPQNLAYLFFVITIFYALRLQPATSNRQDLVLLYLFAMTTFFVHPLAGIPALLFALAITIYKFHPSKITPIFYLIIFLASIIVLPLAFYLTNKNNSFNYQLITNQLFTIPQIELPYQEDFILNFVYLFKFNIGFIITLLLLLSSLFIYRQKARYKILLINIGLSLALLMSYFLTKLLSFGFLIEYERQDYANRILVLAILSLLPLLSVFCYTVLKTIISLKKSIRYPLFILIAILLTSSLYASYPRKDKFFDSHGLSVSGADIQAVSAIENDAAGRNYAVLANQQVSVAALRQFGFRYLDNGMYFYPIPTGGKLYQNYLEMVYQEANRKPIEQAMDLTNTDTIYFVLNKYWWAFDKILAEAKLSADSFIEINNGEIYIFKYKK